MDGSKQGGLGVGVEGLPLRHRFLTPPPKIVKNGLKIHIEPSIQKWKYFRWTPSPVALALQKLSSNDREKVRKNR